MRKIVLLLFSCFVLVWLACAREATVDEVVTMITEASGGAEVLAAVQDQITTWDLTMKMMPPGAKKGEEEMAGEMPMSMQMNITCKRPNKLRFDVIGPDGTTAFSSCFDGTSGWESEMGKIRDMNEAQLQETENTAATWLDGFLHYKDLGYTLAMLPTEDIDNQKYMVLQSTDKYKNVMKYYIDPKTHYIKRRSGEMVNMQGEKEPMYMTFNDYKMVEGIALAHTVAQYKESGEMIWEAKLKEAKFNQGVDDAIFMRPEVTAK